MNGKIKFVSIPKSCFQIYFPCDLLYASVWIRNPSLYTRNLPTNVAKIFAQVKGVAGGKSLKQVWTQPHKKMFWIVSATTDPVYFAKLKQNLVPKENHSLLNFRGNEKDWIQMTYKYKNSLKWLSWVFILKTEVFRKQKVLYKPKSTQKVNQKYEKTKQFR